MFWIFSCGHAKTGWPITIAGQTYTVCHDCGRKFRYDWLTMKRGGEIEDRAYAPQAGPKQPAGILSEAQ